MKTQILQGLHYIHTSNFNQHGALSAYRCLVGDRFDVRIQMYGCSGIKARTKRRLRHKCEFF